MFNDLSFFEEELHELLIHVRNEIEISFVEPFAWQTWVLNDKLGTAMVADDAGARIGIVPATLMPIKRKGPWPWVTSRETA